MGLTILKVIHGYPPYYMAGSEIYTYNLCRELSKNHEISIFTRIENTFKPYYTKKETIENNIRILRVNKPKRDYTFRDKIIDPRLGSIFEEYLTKVNPDIVHIGHLSHLTLLIVDIVKAYEIPIVFTLHDYWMMCIRGQLIRDDFTLCSGPRLEKCLRCNQKYFIDKEIGKREIAFWLEKLREVNQKIDMFIAPSQFLKEKYIEYGIPQRKIIYQDYGFNTNLLKNIQKSENDKVRFGFIGRIIPVKGIITLLKAFNKFNQKELEGIELNIYGRIGSQKLYLKDFTDKMPINFGGGFHYKKIREILKDIDVLIVPSLWFENSPLVIHEGIEANIPIITSDLGGMAELVKHGKNGLLFEPRNPDDLHRKMKRFIHEPELLTLLTQKVTKVRTIQEDARDLEKIYYSLINKKEKEELCLSKN